MATTVLTVTDLKNLQVDSSAYKEQEAKVNARRKLMRQLVTYVTTRATADVQRAANEGRGDTIIFQFRPVLRVQENPERKVYDPEECYWSGLDAEGNRVSASSGGVPFTVLTLGVRRERQDGSRYNDPTSLPDGKTLGALLEEQYKGCKVVTRYNKETQLGTLRLVWNLDEWRAREARRQTQRNQERGRGPRRGQDSQERPQRGQDSQERPQRERTRRPQQRSDESQ